MRRACALAAAAAALLLAAGAAEAYSWPGARQPAAATAGSSTQTHFWYNNVTLVSQYAYPETDLGLFDAVHQRKYWVSLGEDGAKTSTWSKPNELDWRSIDDPVSGRQYFRNDALDLTTWERPACLGWSKRSLERSFYYNTVTHESAWPHEKPDYVPYQTETGHAYWHDKRTQTTTYDPPSEEAAWYEAESPTHQHEGQLRKYYYNALSKLSSWELPARSSLAWKKSYVELEL